MNKCKFVFLFFALLVLCILFVSCSGDTPRDEYVSITLCPDEHCTVIGDTTLRIKVGEDAVFELDFDKHYVFDTADEGIEYSDGVITVKNCRADSTFSFTSKLDGVYHTVGYEDVELLVGKIESNIELGMVKENSEVTLEAKTRFESKFIGWSVDGFILDGGRTVSTENTISFTVTEDIKYYPNFIKKNQALVRYHLNGATDATGDDGIHYVLTLKNKLKCINLLADSGNFYYEGHTLLEYTTEHGGGIAINPGGLAVLPDTDILDVYLVWSKWSDASDFEYRTEGSLITITDYLGDDETVVIPAKISGRSVSKIASGAFTDKSFKTLVMPKFLREIETGGFFGCRNFDTLYITDYFTNITDDAFVECRSFRNLRLNAVNKPCFVKSTESVATRMSYILTRDPNKPIMLLVGGSNVLYGVDSPTLSAALNEEYYVLNCGTNASAPGILFIEAFSNLLQPGDVIINAPEYGNVQLGGTTLYWRAFRAMECCYNIFRYVDFSNYTNFFGAMSDFNMLPEARGGSEGGSYNVENTLLKEGSCDLAKNLKHSEFTGSVTVNGDVLTNDKAEVINYIYNLVESRGITYLFSCCPIYEQGLVDRDGVPEYYAKCQQKLDCPVISNPEDYIMDYQYFSGAAAHLSRDGARLRSEILAEDIIEYLSTSE